MSEHVLVAREGRVLRVTLNREDKRNALTAEMCAAIVEAVEGAAGDRRGTRTGLVGPSIRRR